jgi:hypothetical protein
VATIAKVWPKAKHQPCVFHVMLEINDHVLDAVRELDETQGKRSYNGCLDANLRLHLSNPRTRDRIKKAGHV